MCDVLQHSDSEGVLPGDRRPLQAVSNSSTLASSLAESGADPATEEDEDEEELGSRKGSPERLICSEEEEEEAGQRAAEDGEPEVLPEDNQVDDFASSVLAAISCWHYRVVVTVRLSAAAALHLHVSSNMAATCPLPILLHLRNMPRSRITALSAQRSLPAVCCSGALSSLLHELHVWN